MTINENQKRLLSFTLFCVALELVFPSFISRSGRYNEGRAFFLSSAMINSRVDYSAITYHCLTFAVIGIFFVSMAAFSPVNRLFDYCYLQLKGGILFSSLLLFKTAVAVLAIAAFAVVISFVGKQFSTPQEQNTWELVKDDGSSSLSPAVNEKKIGPAVLPNQTTKKR